MLSETFMDDNEPPVLIPNFDFIVRFQRNEIRNAGVAIYHNQKNRCHIVTPHLDIKAPYSGNPDVTISTSKRIGDICAVECIVNHSENNPKKLILIVIYISPNAAMRDMKLFIAKSLLTLSTAGSQALADVTGEEIDYCERPVILAGDFNVNFSLPEAETLLTFLKDKFGLEVINGRNDPTTKGGTTIDAVFARNIEKIELKHFVSYFSYHNPIVNVVDFNISPLQNDN